MDDAVKEVFENMLERSCAAVDEDSRPPADISAIITLSGTLDALCVVEFPVSSAEKLTSAFLGSETGWDDTMVADSVGELCNMIAGGWKKRLGATAWGADLSTPSICRNCPHNSDCNSQDGIRVRRAYAFEESPFAVSFTAR